MNQNISFGTRRKVYDWLDSSLGDRIPQTEFRKSLHLSAKRFQDVRDDWRRLQEKRGVETKELQRLREIVNSMLLPSETEVVVVHKGEVVEGPEDKEEGQDELQTVLKNLYKLSKKNSNAALIWLKATGNFVEKSEVKIGLSADEIARRNIEADRRIRMGYRVEGVSEKPPILPDPIREDK